MAFENAGVAFLHFFARLADGERARYVGRAVEILAARVEQKERAFFQFAVGLHVRAIVVDRAVRTGAGDGVEGKVLQLASRFAEFLDLPGGVDLGDLAGLAVFIEPMEEAREGGAVAAMRLASAFDLYGVLAGARQGAGVLLADDFGAGLAKGAEEP